MKKFVLLLAASIVMFSLQGQTRAHEINEKLGRGVNLGNTFEAPRDGNWGVALEAADLERIADMGFHNVRIPIRWNDWAATSAPYTIETQFMDTIRSVVDHVLKNKMLPIVNIHHYDDFNDNPDGSHRTRFLAIWKQIAAEFQDYPDSLIFEFLNEPHQTMDAAHWNAIFKQVLDTVRLTNPTRICMVGPPDWNNVNSVDKLVWTADTNMILTVHYYNPFQFTHQGASWVGDQSQNWLGTTWDSTSAQRQAVINDFEKVRNFSETNNVPVHVGEFGAYSAADKDSRARWTAYCARTFESFGFSWSYWEYQAGFGVWDPVSQIWRNYLLNALTEGIDPNSIPPNPWDIRNGSFTNEFTGWGNGTSGEAQAEFTIESEVAKINVTAVDGSPWHVQMSQSGISLIQGGEYRMSFEAWAEQAGTSITSYLGKNSGTYGAYSDYNAFNLSTTQTRYTYTFTMNEPSDPVARAVFDLGNTVGSIYLDSIVLEQLWIPVLTEDIEIGPDPAGINQKGGNLQLTVTVSPENANNKSVSWEIVSGASLASISQEGLLSAAGNADGTVRVKATAQDGSGVTAEIFVEITNQLQVESITLNPTKDVIDTYKGTARIFFEVLPANASNKTLYWEVIQGSELATVDQEGFVDALGTGDGEVIIKASSTDGSGISDQVTLALSNQVLIESIEITTASQSIDIPGGTLQLGATVLPGNASRKEVAWSVVSGSELAEVNQEGLVTALASGNGTITVRAAANDGSGVKDEIDIELSNQGNGIAERQMDTFKARVIHDELLVELPLAAYASTLHLFRIDGSQVLNQPVPAFTEVIRLNVSGIKEGIYILRLESLNEISAIRVHVLK